MRVLDNRMLCRGVRWAAASLGLTFLAFPAGSDDPIQDGQALFAGKGHCAICHTIGDNSSDGRGPDLAGIGARAEARAAQFGIAEPDAGDLYLLHSIIRPAAEVVEGYDPMPETWLASGLTDEEIDDLVQYLRSLGGSPEATKSSLPMTWLAAEREEYQRELDTFSFGDRQRGQALFEDATGKAGCIRCHSIDGKGKDIGPDLSLVNRVHRPSYMLESVLDPSAIIVRDYRQLVIWDRNQDLHSGLRKAEDDSSITLLVDDDGNTEVVSKVQIAEQSYAEVSRMPNNFAQLLTAQDLMDVLAYLLGHDRRAEGAESKAPKGQESAVFGVVTAAMESFRTAMERGDPTLGDRLYAHYCTMCHGAKGDGNGFNAPNLATKPANHTDNRRMSKIEDRLLQGVIARGGMKTGRSVLMPPFGGILSERQTWDLVAYLRTLHAPQPKIHAQLVAAKPAAETSAISTADRKFARVQVQTFCVTCHGKSGKGDGPAGIALKPRPRNWTDKTWQKSVTDEHIRKVLTNGGASVGLSPLMPPNPVRGRPGVISALIEIVRSYGK